MAIRIKTDLNFGDIFYIRTDPDQFEHELVGVVFLPGNTIKFILSYLGDISELYDFQCSKEKNLDLASRPTKDDDDDED